MRMASWTGLGFFQELFPAAVAELRSGDYFDGTVCTEVHGDSTFLPAVVSTKAENSSVIEDEIQVTKLKLFVFKNKFYSKKILPQQASVFLKWRNKSKKPTCRKRCAPPVGGLFHGEKNGKKCGTR